MRNTITEDKLTNTFAVGDKMTGDAPTARTGLAFCHRVILDSVAHLWVPARTFTVHRCLFGGRAVGPRHAPTRHHQNDKTKVYSVTPWLPTWWRSRCVETADLRSSVRAWRQEHVHESTTDPGKNEPKAFTQILRKQTVEVPQVQFEPILVTLSQTQKRT